MVVVRSKVRRGSIFDGEVYLNFGVNFCALNLRSFSAGKRFSRFFVTQFVFYSLVNEVFCILSSMDIIVFCVWT